MEYLSLGSLTDFLRRIEIQTSLKLIDLLCMSVNALLEYTFFFFLKTKSHSTCLFLHNELLDWLLSMFTLGLFTLLLVASSWRRKRSFTGKLIIPPEYIWYSLHLINTSILSDLGGRNLLVSQLFVRGYVLKRHVWSTITFIACWNIPLSIDITNRRKICCQGR